MLFSLHPESQLEPAIHPSALLWPFPSLDLASRPQNLLALELAPPRHPSPFVDGLSHFHSSLFVSRISFPHCIPVSYGDKRDRVLVINVALWSN